MRIGEPPSVAETSASSTAGMGGGPQQLRLDACYRNLERIIVWVGNADTKTLIVLAFQGAIIAVVATTGAAIRRAIGLQPEAWLQILLYGLFTGFGACFCLSLIFAFRAINPDTTPREAEEAKRSPFFFATIAAMSLAEFRDRVRGLDAETIEEELIKQTHVNAGIVTRKFRDMKRTLLWLRLELLFLFVAVLVIALIPRK